MATGRKALTNELKAQEVGLDLDSQSNKILTKFEQTNIPNIYAVGDVLVVSNILSVA